MMSRELVKDSFGQDVVKAIEILRTEQGHPELSEFQIKVVLNLAGNKNCINQSYNSQSTTTT